MVEKNIKLIKKVFETVYKGLTCQVMYSNGIIQNLDYNGCVDTELNPSYIIHINEPYRIFYNPYDFEGEYKFYKNDVVIFTIKSERGINSIEDHLNNIMPHLKFCVSLNHELNVIPKMIGLTGVTYNCVNFL